METLRSRLARDERVIVCGIGRVLHPNFVQCLGINGGFHGVWIDQEHCGLTMREMEVATACARSVGLDSFVRIAPTDYALVTRCFEAGAGGIMAAQVSTAEEAQRIVRWSKFAPRGIRGLNNGGYDGRFGTLGTKEFCETANREGLVIVQIETEQAVTEAEAIAAVDGVDMLFVGPFDLSQALGVTGDFFHPRCLEAIERVALACRHAGKKWGGLTTTPDHCQMLIDQGCSMLSPATDMRLVNAGISAIKHTFKDLF
ncbi:MAG: host specificity protein [Planctomyces sp.]|nr:host specificity protein [Planctomyces sp.]